MNSAQRLANILKRVQGTNDPTAYQMFQKIFEVNGCVPLSNKLRLCEYQINVLREKAHSDLIVYLSTLFDCSRLQRNIDSERKQISSYIMTLESIAAYMPEENIDNNSIKELSDMLIQMKNKVEQADMPEHYRKVLDSFIQEMFEGIVDIDVGGIDAFTSHVEMANGKVVLYYNAFQDTEFIKQANEIYEKSTKILNDAQAWGGALGFTLGKLLTS